MQTQPSTGRRREGFSGQHLLVVPPPLVNEMRADPLLRGLLPCAAGWFPLAPGHWVERSAPIMEDILVLCHTGRGFVDLGGRRHEVAPDSGFLVPSGVPHMYGADEHEPWGVSWVHYCGADRAGLRELLGAGVAAPCFPCPGETGLADVPAQIWRLLDAGLDRPRMLAAGALLRHLLARLALARATPPADRGVPGAAERVHATAAWMRAHLDETLRLADLARHAHLSVSHFALEFRARLGLPPAEYLTRLRIQHAARLLDAPKKTTAGTSTMARSRKRTVSAAEKTLVMLISWLVPGYGFWHNGLRRRAVFFFLTLQATFLVGALLRGSVLLWSLDYRSSETFNLVAILSTVTQLCNGALGLLSMLPEVAHGFHILPYDETNQWADLGSFYLLVSGGMNYFVLMSTWDHFYGRKAQEPARRTAAPPVREAE